MPEKRCLICGRKLALGRFIVGWTRSNRKPVEERRLYCPECHVYWRMVYYANEELVKVIASETEMPGP